MLIFTLPRAVQMRLYKAFGLAGGLSLLPLSSYAQDCSGKFYVETQEQLDIIGANCPVINGSILINGSFTGPFVLNGVRNITQNFVISMWHEFSASHPTSIDLPDLESVDRIYLPDLAASSFSAPKLWTAESLTLGQAAPGSEVNLESLVRVGRGLTLIGKYSTVHLPSLETVNGSLEIYSVDKRGIFETHSSIASAMNLTIPSLTTATRMNLAVKAEAISFPNLQTLVQDDEDRSEIVIRVLEAPAPVSFPQLSSLGGDLRLEGNITSHGLLYEIQLATANGAFHPSLDLSSLQNTSQYIYIDTHNTLNVDLPIRNIGRLSMTGPIDE
ncbi:hypothetical protein BDW74DRAFT_178004 [Aspergillus multicolor]|uniref:uncharacterized protein n=1 Tax=Aspergillus multicolor TaxID=41759 RepID=UPI003CCD2C2B